MGRRDSIAGAIHARFQRSGYLWKLPMSKYGANGFARSLPRLSGVVQGLLGSACGVRRVQVGEVVEASAWDRPDGGLVRGAIGRCAHGRGARRSRVGLGCAKWDVLCKEG